MAEEQVLKTSLNRRWLTKMAIFIIALLALGVWGLWDSLVVYPNRGLHHADAMLLEYLKAADDERRLTTASVEKPAEAYESLRNMEGQLTDAQRARLEWLKSLSRVKNLRSLELKNEQELQKRAADAGYAPQDTMTMFVNPRARMQELDNELSTKRQPKPLHAFDLPIQYLITVVGFGGAMWIVLVLVRAAGRKFTYDPDTHALTLPDGRTIVPDQIEDVDKRKWHKFFVFLHLKDDPEELKLDLLRYEPLEAWILEMEKLTPTYEPPDDESAPDERGGVVADEPGTSPGSSAAASDKPRTE